MSESPLSSQAHELLQVLDREADALEADLLRLRAVLPADSEAAAGRLRTLIATVEKLSALVASPDVSEAGWSDRSGYEAALKRAANAADQALVRAVRERLNRVASFLEAGTSKHRVERMRLVHSELRDLSVQELRSHASSASPPELPGPGEPIDWLPWAWSLSREELAQLQVRFTHLGDFLESVSQAEWVSPTEQPPGSPAQTSPLEAPRSAPPAQGTPPRPPPPAVESPGRVSAADESAAPSAPTPPAVPAVAPEALSPLTAAAASEVVSSDLVVAPESQASTVGSGAVSEAAVPPRASLRVSAAAPTVVQPTQDVAGLPSSQFVEEGLRYSEFRPLRWVAVGGRVSEVPWRNASNFAASLAEAQVAAATAGDLGRALLFGKALAQLGWPAPLHPDDLDAVGRLLLDPMSGGTLNSDRYQRVAEAVYGSAEELGEGAQLAIFLELLRWSPDLLGIHAMTLKARVERAFSRSPDVREVMLWLAGLPYKSGVAVDQLRLALQQERVLTEPEAQRLLAKARVELHEAAKGNWHMNVPRSHCRAAWSEFMKAIELPLKALYPVEKNGAADITDDVAEAVADFEALHERIADDRGAHFDDRKQMDKAARLLARTAQAVIGARNHLRALRDQARQPRGDVPRAALERLSSRPLPADRGLLGAERGSGAEVFIRAALTSIRHGGQSWDPRELAPSELWARPEFLAHGEAEWDTETGALERLKARDALHAAAVLLSEPSRRGAPTERWSSPDAFAAWFLEKGRGDLGSQVSGVSVPLRDRLKAERVLAMEQVHAELSRVRGLARDLDELAIRQGILHLVLAEAAELMDRPDATVEEPFLKAWLGLVATRATQHRDEHVEALRRRGSGGPKGDSIDASLNEGRWAEALFLLGEAGGEGEDKRPLRETAWRQAAAKRFPNATLTLRDLQKAKEGPAEVLDKWVEWSTPQTQSDRGLRNRFAEFVFDTLAKEAVEGSPRWQLQPQVIRTWLAQKGRNPSFLPQLAGYRFVTLLVPSTRVSDAAFVQRTADQVAGETGALCVVLAPRLAADPRARLIKEFRHRKLSAAVVDDLDLLRLLNPGGPRPNPLLGFFEVALEQQRLAQVTPYEPKEGQHVQMEMYVGRRDDADKLLNTSTSRLFSGRKLGKSALLKFLEQTRDRSPLPSGCTLHVLYVPIAGASEAEVVERILKSMQERLGVHTTNGPDPVASLKSNISRWADAHKSDSILVVLDEADVFFEEQLVAYDEKQEKCLSFQMRTNIESIRDSMGHPRVRFLMAGYRATHGNGGAWANWGEVLMLSPLAPEDAAELVEGPLARIGIDAREQAPLIAWRCGYQPAVLIRFGRRLLEHLEASRGGAGRDSTIVVTAQDAAAVFAHPIVEEEIQTVVRNNFQDNQTSWVVFVALLCELAELPPGVMLDAAAERVLARLQRSAAAPSGATPPLNWLYPAGGSPHAELNALLREFEQRRLITRTGAGVALRFPHHLDVLRQLDLEATLTKGVRAIERDDAPAKATDRRGVPGLLSYRALEDLRFALGEGGFKLGIVATAWPGALETRTRGVADLLGIPPENCHAATRDGLAQARKVSRPVLYEASSGVAESVISGGAQLKGPPLLIGGADLLRWALEKTRLHSAIEVASVGRLSVAELTWWFRRVRCFEFADTDAIGLIRKATGGIPYLVEAVDKGLSASSDDTKSSHELQSLLSTLRQRLPQLATGLLTGGPAVRLTPRETELLRLCLRAAEWLPGQPPGQALLSFGEDICSELGLQPPTPADQHSLLVLQRLGFLPFDAERDDSEVLARLSPLEEGDPLVPLVKAMAGGAA